MHKTRSISLIPAQAGTWFEKLRRIGREISAFAGMSVVLIFASFLPASAQDLFPLQPHPESLEWPTDAWDTGNMPEETAVAVNDLIAAAMAGEKTDTMGETRAVVVIHQGELVAEAYRGGVGPETKQVSWSMAKSITQALVGRAVHLGLIEDIDTPMPTPFEPDDPRNAITWRQWLNMTDGLDYKDFETTPFMETDVVQMMYGRGKYDFVDFIDRELPLKHEPGTRWYYSTEGFHLLGWALLETTRLRQSPDDRPERNRESLQPATEDLFKACMRRFENASVESVADPERMFFFEGPCAFMKSSEFFDLIGMNAQPEFDAAGTFLGGSLVWASARDFAKFGYLYLRDGVWEDERLLPEGWVDFARTETPAENANVYGAGWWVTVHGDETPTSFQSALTPPWDAFNANGNEGQTIWVVPSRDLVIVRLGLMDNSEENWSALFEWNQQIARAFPEIE